MNIEKMLTCKYCNKVYNEPITLTCCGESLCKQHIQDLLSIDDTNSLICPFCNKLNSNQNFKVTKTIQDLLDIQAHKFKIDPKLEQTFTNFQTEIRNLELILNEPENFIYEEINELKRQVDLDREKAKAEIDELADDLIQQLKTYEEQFKTEYKANVDMKHFIALAEASKKQFNEYEQYLNLLSYEAKEREKHNKNSEDSIIILKSKIKELKAQLFLNLDITYNPMEIKLKAFFGKLKTRSTKKKLEFLGIKKKEFQKNSECLSLTVLPNGDLVSETEDTKIKIWDVNAVTVKQILTENVIVNYLIAISNNCVISAAGNFINIWDITKATVVRTLSGHNQAVFALTMLKNGDLASASVDKTIKIWNIDNGTLIRTLTGHTEQVWSLVVLKNGDLVSGSTDQTIKIWDVDSGTVKMTLTGHTSCVSALTILENGDFVSGSWDKTIKIWSIVDGTVKKTLTRRNFKITALKVLDNGDLISGDNKGSMKIWNLETGTVKKDIEVNSPINSLQVLENGDLVSASDYSIIIWD